MDALSFIVPLRKLDHQVDACPRAFAVILNWLRYRQLMLGNIGAEEVHLLSGRNIKC